MVNLNGMRLNQIIKRTGISIELYDFFSICDDYISIIEYIKFVKSEKNQENNKKSFIFSAKTK